ncbi:MAG: phosphate acyltransferase, partial [Bacilli bacterium]|nr:phosphate acyltransferase [Bacilli bacterium]
MSFNKLLLKVGKLPPQRLVVVSADDSSVIKTIVRAKNSGFVLPILIGNIKGIEEKLLKLKTDLNDYQLIEAASPEDAAFLAVELIRNNKADLLMKGLIETRILLKAVVNSETGIKKEKLLSHVAVFTYPVIEGFLLASDCAMVINPDLEQKKG